MDQDCDDELIGEMVVAMNVLLMQVMGKVRHVSVMPVPGEDEVSISFTIGPIIDGEVH